MTRPWLEKLKHAGVIRAAAGQGLAYKVRQVKVAHRNVVGGAVRALKYFGGRPCANARNGAHLLLHLMGVRVVGQSVQSGTQMSATQNRISALVINASLVPFPRGNSSPTSSRRRNLHTARNRSRRGSTKAIHQIGPRVPGFHARDFLLQNGGH